MLDYDPDLIAGALDEFRAAEAVAPQAPGGVAAVRATVARRRRWKTATMSVAGALLVAVPIAAFAAHPRGNNPPPDVLESKSAPARDALFHITDLWEAKAPVPAGHGWEGCPTRLSEPAQAPTVGVWALGEIHTNLDDDTGLETAVLVECRISGRVVTQVVGYDIDASGAPVSLGVVVPPPPNQNYIRGMTYRYPHGVIVTVALGEPVNYEDPEPQQREFAWDGKGFSQVGGPVAFPGRIPGDLSVTAGPLRLDPGVNGVVRGSISVTVRYEGTGPTPFVRIGLRLNGLTIEGTDQSNVLNAPGLKPGDVKVFDLKVLVEPGITGTTMTVEVQSYIQETTPDNNQVVVAINRL